MERMFGSKKRSKNEIPILPALMILEQLFIFELFKDVQDAILLILHCKTML